MDKNILNKNEIKEIIENIRDDKLYFVNKKITLNITKSINELFPILNQNDIKNIEIFIVRLIDIISLKLGLNNIDNGREQWLINDNMDIKSLILIFLPFLDNIKDDGNVFKSLTSLKQILINNDGNILNREILDKPRTEVMKKEFYYSNFSINLAALNNSYYNYDDKIFNGNADILLILMIGKFNTMIESIKFMANKLYVNWINVVPVSKESYASEQMYQDTINKYDIVKTAFDNETERFPNILNKWLINNNLTMLGYIDFDYDSSISLYNYPGVLSKLIYEDIKKIKWMIYCRNKNSNSGYYYIQVLSEIFNLTNMVKYKYHDLPSSERKKFNKNYDKMLNSFLNNKLIIDNYSKEEQYDVMKNFMVFLVSNNSNIIKLEKNYVFAKFRINNNIEEEIDDEINNINLRNLNSTDYYNAFINLNRNLFWDYMRDCLLKLRYNYLGSFLFEGDSINKTFYYYNNSKLTLKNIYNYGKILTFEDFNEKKKYNYDKFINNEQKQKEIFDILFNFRGNVNFIDNNLRLQLGKRNTDTWFTEVKKDLSANIHKIVWETLIHNGLLSKFTVNHDINDKKNLTNNDKMNKKIIANKLESIIPEYKNCNYFFTNDSYNNLPKIMDNGKETTYLKQLSGSKFDFYLAYSFNWIFQINFFNHFCYNNINYITGSTGQGKSTQVPKLYTYAFKAFNFIANPKVVCTQPRLDPTENIAWVAQEAGLPINYIINDKTIYTNNYQMQFKHSQNNHMKEECYHPVIRFVTDGTIYNDIKKNIFLTRTYYDVKTKEWVSVKDSTQYNAVLIDEAHEHNMNMDLILSDLRITCMRNSKVKLGIISATMDDDEPVYRAFYLDVELPHNNSIWIDPRLHISPPGTTTKHKIVEHYSIDENPKENIIRTIRKVKEILKNYPVGQILVFSTGQGDILKLVEKINKETSSDVITLPYFSAMNTIYKRLVRNITDELPKLKNKKHRVHLEWGEKFISDKSVPNNIYKRAVIIATNVAEASITIPGLKFVVDNGYQKVSKYDMLKKTKSLIVEEISEASRLQRKGRVGRKEAGDVFYLYREGARAENPPKFKITQENISDILFSILSNQENLNEAIKLLDKNNKDIFKEFIEHKIKDYLGKYYIVNPFEDKIKRNIIHEIISFNDKEQNRIDKEYFEGFFNNLSKNLMIMFVKENDRKEILDVSLQYNEKYNIKTTEFFKAIDSMSSKLMLERKYIITILMSKLANVFDEVFIMIPMIILLGNGLSSLATNRGKDFKYLLGKFGNYSSDIYSIYMIVSSFKKYFKDLTLFSMIDDKKKIIKENNNIYKTQQKLYNKYISINQGHYKSNNIIDEDTFQIFNKLNSMKIYDDEMRFQEWFKINKPLDEIYLKEFKDNNDIQYWCSSNRIEYNFIFNYYKSLISLYKSMETLDTNIDVSKNEINYFKLYGKEEIQRQGKSKVSNLNLLEKLELVFIYGNIDNLYYREPETDRYISFYSDSKYGFINNYFGKNISFNQTPTEFICCINSIERNDISLLNIIINLKPEILGKYLGTHFNKNNFPNYTKKKYRDKDTNFEITRIYRESRNSLISFYQKIYNNTGIEYHLLYNKEIDEDKESKTDNVKLYDMMKNLKL